MTKVAIERRLTVIRHEMENPSLYSKQEIVEQIYRLVDDHGIRVASEACKQVGLKLNVNLDVNHQALV